MILHSINTNRRMLTIIFFVLMEVFFSCEAFSEQKNPFNIPNKTGRIFWKCDHDLCNTYLKIKNKNIIVISEKSSSPSVVALNKNLISLFFSCGSPCNYTMFYDAKNGVSRSFEFVVVVDAKREIVVLAENNQLIAYKIFDNVKSSLFSIKRNWSPTATLFGDIIEAKFVDDGLYVKYLEGRDFHEKEEIIHNLHGSI